MRRASGVLLVLTAAVTCPTVAVAAPGDLDPSLGADGIIRISEPAYANRVAPRAEGGFIIAGTSGRHVRSVAELWAYLPNGEIDRRFGEHGRVELQPQGSASSSRDVQVLPSGDIVTSGCLRCTTTDDPIGFVARLRSDGSFDESFGSNGVTVDPRLGGGLYAYDDGRLLVVGGRTVARLLPNGSPDPSFSGDGLEDVTPIVITAFDVQGDGSVLFGGYNTDDPPELDPIQIRRLRSDGSPDPGFGGDGVVDFDTDPAFGSVVDIVVDVNQRLVVGAEGCTPIQLGPGAGSGSRCTTTILRFLPNGDPDYSVGPDGRRTMTAGAGLVKDPQGRILVFGIQSPGAGFANTFSLQRLLADGTVDFDFGLSGTTYAYDRFHAGQISGGAAMADGSFLGLGGLSEPPYERVLMRFSAAGEPGDLDADGSGDGADRCPLFWGRRASGCSTMKRTVSISRRYRRDDKLDALIDAPLVACEQRQRVLVRRIKPGRDPIVGSGKTDTEAGPRVQFAGTFRPGRYYAQLPRHRSPRIGLCGRARSSPINVPAESEEARSSVSG